jgi:hypothetical protein
MSARKTDEASLLGSKNRPSRRLALPVNEVSIRKSGIEFRSARPIASWTEMTVSLQIPGETRKVNCTGVVVACSENEDDGYLISMLFTDLTPQSRNRLSAHVH